MPNRHLPLVLCCRLRKAVFALMRFTGRFGAKPEVLNQRNIDLLDELAGEDYVVEHDPFPGQADDGRSVRRLIS